MWPSTSSRKFFRILATFTSNHMQVGAAFQEIGIFFVAKGEFATVVGKFSLFWLAVNAIVRL